MAKGYTAARRPATAAFRYREARMWWAMGIVLAIIWISLLIVLGVATLRNGHTVLFIIGIFFPILWIFGAILPPTERALARGV